MKFTVIWLPVPEAELEKLWIAASDRKAVELAANWIDRQLLNDPLAKLTPIDAFYFIRCDPLIVLCDVSVDDRLVSIIEVHRTDLLTDN